MLDIILGTESKASIAFECSGKKFILETLCVQASY
jgi:hypothetical protein